MKFKKSILPILTSFMLLLNFSGCASETKKEDQPPKENIPSVDEDGSVSSGFDEGNEENPIVYRLVGSAITTLSPHQHIYDPVRVMLTWTCASLYNIIYDENTDNLTFISVLAEDFPESEDNKTWTYQIREGLKFDNGNPITAETIEYSWKMLLDPVLKSPGAGGLYAKLPIVNAQAYYLSMSEEDYNRKKEDPEADWSDITPSDDPVQWEDVGIKALDPHQLQITLSNEFTQIDMVYNFTASGSLSIVDPELYEACMNADRTENDYGTTLDKLAQSGPYILVDWAQDQHRVYERNKDWPGGLELYTPDVIEERVISDMNAQVQLFENGELDYLVPTGTHAENYSEDPRALKTEGPVVWGYYINAESESNPILQDVNFRYALFYGTDRQSIARDVYKVYLPANYFISRRAVVGNILSGAQRYRDTPEGMANQGESYSFNKELALSYFDAAYTANGSQKVSVALTYFDTSESQKRCAEVLKEDYEEIFGADRFELVLQAMPSEAAYDSYMSRNHDMGFGTMGQDSFNPWATLDVWSTLSSEKADNFYNAEYDSLQSRGATGDLVMNPEERTKALGRMEELLLEFMPWIPIYQNDGIVVFSDRVSVKPSRYITSIAYAPWQAEMTNDVPRSIVVD